MEKKEERWSYKDFNELKIGGKFKVHINKGEKYEVSANGKSNYLDKINMNQSGELLDISVDFDHISSPVHLYITLPELKSISAESTDDVQIKDFRQNALAVNHTGDDELKIYGEVDSLKLNQCDNSKVDVMGKVQYLEAYLTHQSKLDIEKSSLAIANLDVVDGSRVHLPLVSDLKHKKDATSRIRMEGKLVD